MNASKAIISKHSLGFFLSFAVILFVATEVVNSADIGTAAKPIRSPINIRGKYEGVGANQIVITNLKIINEAELIENMIFGFQIRELEQKGDFEKLESMAQEFRSNKSRFRNGDWKLRAFYMSNGNVQSIGNDTTYSNLISQLERWAAEKPDSITPRLALVAAYHGYAYLARGGAVASQVTEQGWKLMHERMAKGYVWLRETLKIQDKVKDPAFYAIALESFLGANVDRKIYESYFEAGIQNSPDYEALYDYKAYYLFPRWYGEKGEWEAFVRKTTKRNDIPRSAEIFARVAIYLNELVFFYEEFSKADDAWEELKSSFHTLEKNYPNSFQIKSICCKMSIDLWDYREAREQFNLLNGNVDLLVWTSKEAFLQAAASMNNSDAYLESRRKIAKGQLP